MARPVNVKSGRVELLATRTEKHAWRECAELDGRTLSEWMRWKLNEAVSETFTKRKGKK